MAEGRLHLGGDADLKSYFDTIPHDRLMARLGERIADGAILRLIRAFLQQGVMEEMKGWEASPAGTPQGAVMSPLLANVYLNPLDHEMARKGYRMVRAATLAGNFVWRGDGALLGSAAPRSMNTPSAEPSPDRLMQIAWGYAPTLVVHAALRHGVFDLLDSGARSLEHMVRETGTAERGMRALLNALVGLQLLRREGDRYALTAESAAFLVSTKREFRGLFFDHHVDQLLPQWQALVDVVRSGRPVRRTNAEDEGAAHFAAFVESLFPGGVAAASVLGRHLRLAEAQGPVSVLDIGTGSGVWGITLAQQSPRVQVRAVDFPAVLEVTRKVAVRQGVLDRFTAVPGDYLEADFGEGHQVATLGHVLHSEGPERIRTLLRRIHAALAPGGVLAIQEFLPDDSRTGPSMPLLFAVNMLVNTEAGDTYTFAEIRSWLEEAGFTGSRLLEVPAVSPLILADRV